MCVVWGLRAHLGHSSFLTGLVYLLSFFAASYFLDDCSFLHQLTKSEVPGKIASAMSIERGLFENDGFDEEEGHVSTTRLLASSSTSPPTVKSSLKRPSS